MSNTEKMKTVAEIIVATVALAGPVVGGILLSTGGTHVGEVLPFFEAIIGIDAVCILGIVALEKQ